MNKLIIGVVACLGIVAVIQNSCLPGSHESVEPMAAGTVHAVTDQNFEELIGRTDKVVMLNFWSDTCPPSLLHGPIMNEAAQRLEGHLLVGSVNLDKQKNLGHRLGIQRIPTMIFFKDGQERRRSVGVHSRQMVYYEIEAVVQLDEDSTRVF